MAATLPELVGFLDELLEPDRFEDYGPNGLQVPGREAIELVVTGVSAHGELLDAASELGADLVLVHHGLFWRGQPLEITPTMHRRLKVLYESDIALAAYHLPLDAHPAHGNNALLGAALGLVDTGPLAEIGRAGRLPRPQPLERFVDAIAAAVERQPLVIAAGPAEVRRVGIVTGAGTDYVDAAVAAGCDTFLTGEPAERAYGLAKDHGINFVAAGHHATETFGVRRLGELLADRFAIEHRFVDVANPI